MVRFDIPEQIQTVLSCLRGAGFRAVPVGGCVRDLLLGTPPNDWDITTSATPDEMLAVFKNFRTLEIGQSGVKHGTVTVILDHVPIEVTTFRQDGIYSDGRRPDNVQFSRALEDDLARRDFTINALCLEETGGIIDLYGGRRDLQQKLIRAIGVPDRRFQEDALRILRALRFAAVLGFEIEPQTAASMRRHIGLLAALSAERVRAELEKLLCAPDCTRVLLEYQAIFFAIMPELRPMPGMAHLYTHAVRAAGAAPAQVPVRMALLLHDLAGPLYADGRGRAAQSAKLAESILRRLKFGNNARAQILFLVQHCGLPLGDMDTIQIKRLLSKHGFKAMRNLLALQRADILAGETDIAEERLVHVRQAEGVVQSIAAQQLPLTRGELAVSGRALIAMGVQPGPQIGVLLDLLLQRVLEEELPNEPAALLNYAADWLNTGSG